MADDTRGNGVVGAIVLPAAQKADGLSETLERFCELPYLEDEDYTRPTQYAYTSSLQLVLQARDLIQGELPRALLTTTEQGGTNWYWRKPEFSVQLTVASTPSGSDYIYVRDRGQSSISKDMSAAHLAKWIEEYNRWQP